jgi:rubrerythrin
MPLLAPAGAAGAQGAPVPPSGANLNQQTLANLLAAMQGEAYAYAKYDAYRQVAGGSLAALWSRTANTELRDHFAGFAAAYKLAGTNAANLQAAVAGENYETTLMYPAFAARAAAAGDKQAAQLFNEIAADEADHRDGFAQALAAVTTGGSIPAPPTVQRVRIVVSTSNVSAQTKNDLLAAMHGEAFAHAKYLAYAQAARARGQVRLAQLFTGTSNVELREHFAAEANLAGLAGNSRANLLDAVSGETSEATVLYPDAAQQAYTSGERAFATCSWKQRATKLITRRTSSALSGPSCGRGPSRLNGMRSGQQVAEWRAAANLARATSTTAAGLSVSTVPSTSRSRPARSR